MDDSWAERVAVYIDQLEHLVDGVDYILQATQVDATRPIAAKTNVSTEKLRACLDSLEQKVAERELLLRADDAPPAGTTLIQKLDSINLPELARHADHVAERIQLAHQRSMSLFVCQFHLSNLTTDLVRILTGGDHPATYGGRDTRLTTPQGGLFNQSA